MDTKGQLIVGRYRDNRNAIFDIPVLMRTRLLIQANSGGGKSWVMRRLAEQLFGKVQVIIIDPEGEFSSLREKYGYVLVGEGGETPADPRSAGLLAEKLLEVRASAVCDLFESFRKNPQGRHTWVKNFCNGLLDAPKKLWHPVVVMVDEFHRFVPEKGAGESEASESVIGIGTAGRKRGYCLIGATQRLGKVRKDVTAEMLNRLVGPTFEDIDLDRSADLLSVRREDRRVFFEEMRVLEPGNFYALGRAICKTRMHVRVGPVTTTHPEIGQSGYASTPPPAPETVKALLPKLADLPQQAEEKAKTIAELKAEVRSLKAQARAQTPVIDEARIKRERDNVRREYVDAIKSQAKEFDKYAHDVGECTRKILALVQLMPKPDPLSNLQVLTVDDSRLMPSAPQLAEEPSPRRRIALDDDEAPVSRAGVKLKDGARRMLAAAVKWSPDGISPSQMKTQARIKHANTFSTYKTQLLSAGYIETRNGLFYATPAGTDHVGGNIESPETTQQVMDLWLPLFKDGARRMLKALVKLQGVGITPNSLMDLARIEHPNTFSTYKTQLKSAHLVVEDGNGLIMANKETLFL